MRPRIEIDEDKVVELASKGATVKYIAAFFDISEATMYRRFERALEIGRELRNGCLQMRQFEAAMAGSGLMLKWLGQQWLDQRDRVETSVQTPKGYGKLPVGTPRAELGDPDQPN